MYKLLHGLNFMKEALLKVKRRLRALIPLALIFAALFGTASAFDGKSSTDVFYKENEGDIKCISSRAKTVAGFLAEQKITLGDFDTVTPSVDTELEQSMNITVLRGITVNIILDGRTARKRPVQTAQMTLGEFAYDYSLRTGTNYICDETQYGTELTDGMEVQLSTKKSATFTKDDELPFDQVVQESPDLAKGVSAVLIPGETGVETSIIRVNYVSNVEVSRQIVSETVTREPVSEVILQGTGEAGPTLEELDAEAAKIQQERIDAARAAAEQAAAEQKAAEAAAEKAKQEAAQKAAEQQKEQEAAQRVKASYTNDAPVSGVIDGLDYTNVLVMSATAYTADYESTGKNPGDPGFGITYSGMKAQVGVVAVDPSVIPLGTKLYIEGYGEAVAGDTGGAIQGNKIDLYFNSEWECTVFGRQQLKVYVLK